MKFLEKYLAILVSFFFLYVPLYYALSIFFGIPVNFIFALTTLLLFYLAVFTAWRSEFSFHISKNILRNHWPLIITLLLFALTHIINFNYYTFLPEWDGYTKLLEVEEIIESEQIQTLYRGFFTLATAIISKLAFIDPYYIFSVIYVGLHSSIIIVLYLLLKQYQVKNRVAQLAVLCLPLAVPVLAMETDMTRPQNIFLIFLPVYVYFLAAARKTNQKTYWTLTTLIALTGLNYHEFFAVLALLHFAWIGVELFGQLRLRPKDSKNKIIAVLSVALLITSFLLLKEKVVALQYVVGVAGDAIRHILVIDNWRLWFLDSYNTDGPNLNLGWPGITGAFKYYAYYLSPILVLVITGFVYTFVKFPQRLKKDYLLQTMLPIGAIALMFSELLPRMNFVFLPERFWVITDTVLILSTVIVIAYLSRITIASRRRVLSYFIFGAFFVIGLGGSFYIAKAKSSLTSPEEYQAANWVQKNTPESSVFITQNGNTPMIRYFARRSILTPDESYFLSESIVPLETKQLRAEKDALYREASVLAEEALTNYSEKTLERFSGLVQHIDGIDTEIQTLEEKLKSPHYVLFSTHKLKGIYAEREWWLKTNFAGANLKKFDQVYERVYDQDGITIWKIE